MVERPANWLQKQVREAQETIAVWPEWVKRTARFEGFGGLEHLRDAALEEPKE